MDKQPGNQPGGPELSASDSLCAAIEAQRGNILVRTSPLGAILPLLVAQVRATDRQVAALTSRMSHLESRQSRLDHAPPAAMGNNTDLAGKLAHVIAVGEAEGQLPRRCEACDE